MGSFGIGFVRHDQAVEKSATGLSARAPTSAGSPLSDGLVLALMGLRFIYGAHSSRLCHVLYIEAELPELDLGFEVKLFFLEACSWVAELGSVMNLNP